jgi:hypothetical protein
MRVWLLGSLWVFVAGCSYAVDPPATTFEVGGKDDSERNAIDLWVSGSIGVVDGSYDNAPIRRWDGASWAVVDDAPFVSDRIRSIWASGPDDVFLVGSDGSLHWNGKAWSQLALSPNLESISGTGPCDVWAAGHDSVPHQPAPLWHYDGTTWERIEFRGRVIKNVWAAAIDDVYVVGQTELDDGSPSGIARHFDGRTWSDLPAIAAMHPTWVGGTGSTDVWITTSSGVAFHWDGVTFRRHTFPPMEVRGLWGAAPDDIWAVGAQYELEVEPILHWDGTSWKIVTTGMPVGYWYEGVVGTAADDVYIVGRVPTFPPALESGMVLHFDGTTWTQIGGEQGNGGIHAVWLVR